MRVDKVIVKAFISTFSAIVLLFAFMFGMLSLAFPSTMMELSYDFGQDETSIRYAERAYDWFADPYYMAYAMEVAIGSDNQEKIESCGEELTKDEQYFTQYCAEKQATLSSETKKYEDFLYGKIAVAKYQQGKKAESVNYAFDTLKGGFPLDNAAIAVFYAAVTNGDQETVDMIKGKMEEQQASTFADGEKAEFDKMLALMSK
jgi:hypothetical protein